MSDVPEGTPDTPQIDRENPPTIGGIQDKNAIEGVES